MPLVYVDLIEGRTPAEIRTLLDAIHDAVVEPFGVPPRDRYQVVRTHSSQRRSPEMKQRFYELAAVHLAAHCGLDSADLMVSITDNGDDDWSLGHGRAQFLTGELA